MSFHDKAEAQEGANLARVDSRICTAANNGFPSSLSLRKVDSEQGRHQTQTCYLETVGGQGSGLWAAYLI